tara:strand:- start:10 stop:777 length:768 start_codon:yes stop_codon:yes gene_type:complete
MKTKCFNNFNQKIKKEKKNFPKKYMGHTSNTFGIKQLELYKERLENVRLTWCQQVFEIVKKLNYSNPKINDLGCNYFQFYKEIKINKYLCNYFGYDIDKKFINLGLTKFPELKKKYKLANIENTNLRKSDISIIADTLEHTEKPEKILKNIISSTKKIIILRTFLSSEEKVQMVKNKKILNAPYLINCFSFNMINEYFIKNDFFPQVYPDLATNFSKINNVFPDVQRRFFIVVFTKKNYLLKNFKTKVYKKLFSN